MDTITPLYAFLGTLVTTIAGLVVLWLNQRAEFRKAELERTQGKAAAVADAAVKDEKLNTIHVLVNSRLSEALGQVEDLKKLVTQLIEPKSIQGQRDHVLDNITADARVAIAKEPDKGPDTKNIVPPLLKPQGQGTSVLDKIQTNTAETASNTARTEAKVDAIVSPLDALVASGRLTQAEADSLKPKGM
jgi:hypothetical protein